MIARIVARSLLLAIPLQAHAANEYTCNSTASNLALWVENMKRTQQNRPLEELQTKLYQDNNNAYGVTGQVKKHAIYLLDKDLSVEEMKAELYSYCLTQ